MDARAHSMQDTVARKDVEFALRAAERTVAQLVHSAVHPRARDSVAGGMPYESGQGGPVFGQAGIPADGTVLLGAVRVNIDRGFVTVGAHVLPAALRVSFDRGVVEWGDVEEDKETFRHGYSFDLTGSSSRSGGRAGGSNPRKSMGRRGGAAGGLDEGKGEFGGAAAAAASGPTKAGDAERQSSRNGAARDRRSSTANAYTGRAAPDGTGRESVVASNFAAARPTNAPGSAWLLARDRARDAQFASRPQDRRASIEGQGVGGTSGKVGGGAAAPAMAPSGFEPEDA